MTSTLPLEHATIDTNGVTLHTIMAGPKDGKPVILLHGFPEFWYEWRNLIPYLAGRGYRVIAPDQRGYNLSSKPKGIRAYVLDTLADDINGLAAALGYDRFSVVAHDWGAGVAWWLASRNPERLERMVIINVPHHAVMSRAIRKTQAQRSKSWYIYFFQLPLLPELTSSGNTMWRAMTGSARPGTFSKEDEAEYRKAWSQPGAMTAMINWYRALRYSAGKVPRAKIKTPTLLIWGAQDKFLGEELAQPSIDLCEDGRLEVIRDATHWVMHEEVERVNGLIGEWLK